MKSLLQVGVVLAGGAILWGGTSAWAQRVRIPTTVDKIQTSPALKESVTLDVANQLSLLSSSVKELQKENADLKKRLSEVEKQSAQSAKDMVAMRLLVPAMDKALTAQQGQINDFKAEFKEHRHGRYLSYQPLDALLKNKATHEAIMIPHVWMGQEMYGLNHMSQSDAIKKLKADPKWDRTSPPTAPK